MNDTQKIQQVLLGIVDDIVAICEKHQIKYCILGGTLLGAVRHKGFIPWDDDFDIGMERTEFERFIKICKTELDPNKYFLQTADSEPLFAYSMAKVQLLGTTITEDFSLGVDIHHGIFVDIFPYDKLPQGKFVRKLFLFRTHLMHTILWIKCGYGVKEHAGRSGYKALKVIGKLHSIDGWKQKIYCSITKYNGRNLPECFSNDYPKEILKCEWIEQLGDYSFENKHYKGIRDYDGYLSALYGDYMTLPPEEDREVHTNYKVDFGIYE